MRRFYGKIRVRNDILDGVAGYFRKGWQVWSGIDIFMIETGTFFETKTLFSRLNLPVKKIKTT